MLKVDWKAIEDFTFAQKVFDPLERYCLAYLAVLILAATAGALLGN